MTPPGDPAQRAQAEAAHWRASLRLTAWLLAAWFAVTFVVAWFARDLQFEVLGWPVGFWSCAQGALLVYVAITWAYARAMRRLDARFGVDADAGAGTDGPAQPPAGGAL